MAQTYPDDEFIPIADTFEQAVRSSTDCMASSQFIESAKTDAERVDGFERYDKATKAIEKLMREAVADGELPPFIRASNGQFEILLDRERFRQMSFGIPGFDNIPHHLTSPGADTDGLAVYLKKSDFQEWASRHGLDPSFSAPKKMTDLDSPLHRIMSELMARGEATSIAEAARLVVHRAKSRGSPESVAKRLARGYSRQQKPPKKSH